VHRNVRVHPGAQVRLAFQVPASGAWSLHYGTTRPGYLSNERALSVVAGAVSFREP
jgi:hypothetical protein